MNFTKQTSVLLKDFLFKTAKSFLILTQTKVCSGAGTRGNGVPTPFSRFVNGFKSSFKWLYFWMRTTPFFLTLNPWHKGNKTS